MASASAFDIGPGFEALRAAARMLAVSLGTAAATASVEQRMPPPEYPVEAARQYIGGEVVLLATVGPDGVLRDIQVESATPEGVFEETSLAAARKWTYLPAMQGGRPVEGRVRIPITFESMPSGEEPEAGEVD